MSRKQTTPTAYSFGDRLRSIPTGLRLAGFVFPILFAVALGVYFIIAQTGLWQALVVWQADDRGTYRPTITGLISVLIPAGLASLPGLLAGAVLVWLNVFPPDEFHPDLRNESAPRTWARAHLLMLLSLNAGSFLVCTGLVLGYVAYDQASLLIFLLGLVGLVLGSALLATAALLLAISAFQFRRDSHDD